MQILKCTLRDGGYHCSRDFDDSTVQRYVDAVVHAGIDLVGVRFRSASNEHRAL